ncbi:hypothetical protein M430DRAFT_29330 [Amorphotheca resinae ATCC 22711]|uniref:Uncharacterized protein n=1 Tax=Amorphotheca resinae ATCC 22711 TaxID=857342 RepID=A0A2T3AZ68_AMORE|nr:hypothetical protein M430DRAFT_29330 [Amorphotheca resinae ATCC 22711]PSS15358.1 hypothetical protein M430DRAFT_29330 [Amorphotheca resinae ATCC 22711]
MSGTNRNHRNWRRNAVVCLSRPLEVIIEKDEDLEILVSTPPTIIITPPTPEVGSGTEWPGPKSDSETEDEKGRTDRDAVGEKDDVRIRGGGGRQRRSFTLSASDAEEERSRSPKQARTSSDRVFRISLKSKLAKATGIKANEDVQRTTSSPSHGPASSTEAGDIIEQVVSEGNVPWKFKWKPRWVPDTAAQHEAMVVNLQSCHHFIDNVRIDTLAAYEAAKMRTRVKTELERWKTPGKIYPGGCGCQNRSINIQKCNSKVCKSESESCSKFYGTGDSISGNMNESWGPCGSDLDEDKAEDAMMFF